MIVLYFILGGIYTIILILSGMYIGYTLKQEKIQLPNIKDHFRGVLKMDKLTDAGPVKPITKVEREAEINKGFTDRVKELTSD